MLRVGKKFIVVFFGVDFLVKDNVVIVKGLKGILIKEFNNNIIIKLEDGYIIVERFNDELFMRVIYGIIRVLINNMVKGVYEGYRKIFILVGVGYRVVIKGKGLEIFLGYFYLVIIDEIFGIIFFVEKNIIIYIDGVEKELVG